VTPDPYAIAALDEPPAAELVAPPADEWLQRRALGFGASDIAALFVGYDVHDPAELGDKARKNGHRFARGKWKLPRIVLEKAGIVPPLAGNSARDAGKDRERMLVQQWRGLVERGQAGADAEFVNPTTIQYVPDIYAIELIPFIDREEPRLVVSPDVFARDVFGGLGCWDSKCSVNPYASTERGFFYEHVVQVNAQMAACGGTHGGVIEGCGWGGVFRDHPDGTPSGRIQTWAIDRDGRLITTIRQVVRRAWDDVLAVRAEMEAA
jgi:hypothetical protein